MHSFFVFFYHWENSIKTNFHNAIENQFLFPMNPFIWFGPSQMSPFASMAVAHGPSTDRAFTPIALTNGASRLAEMHIAHTHTQRHSQMVYLISGFLHDWQKYDGNWLWCRASCVTVFGSGMQCNRNVREEIIMFGRSIENSRATYAFLLIEPNQTDLLVSTVQCLVAHRIEWVWREWWSI